MTFVLTGWHRSLGGFRVRSTCAQRLGVSRDLCRTWPRRLFWSVTMFEVGDVRQAGPRLSARWHIDWSTRVDGHWRQPMLADAVNTELFITINASAFPHPARPDRISTAGRPTLSRRHRTWTAPLSPQKAAEYVAVGTTVRQKSFVLDGDGDESMSSQLTAARRGRRGATSPLVDLVVSRPAGQSTGRGRQRCRQRHVQRATTHFTPQSRHTRFSSRWPVLRWNGTATHRCAHAPLTAV